MTIVVVQVSGSIRSGLFFVIAGFACITETLPHIYAKVMTSLALPDYPPRKMKQRSQSHAEVTSVSTIKDGLGQLYFWRQAGNSHHSGDHLGA
jgi:hypothetical protein